MSERPSDEATIDAAVASDDADGRAYRVKLPMFEGPLDLLLHLIQKHELNILEIPIGFVALKYVEYIRMMEEMSIDIASEYLVMAATLAYIKSRELLPPDPSRAADEAAEEEEEDPRAELIRKLLEYQKYKHAADNLGDREVLGRDVFARGLAPDQSDEEAPLAPMSLFKLVDAFEGLLKRAKQVQEHQIDFEKVSISDRVGQIVERLRTVRTLRFEQLFDGDITRAEMIVTFLALLEMTKLRMTRLTQEGPLAPIVVELVLSAEQVRNFDAERAFDSHIAMDEDFAAPKPWPAQDGAAPPEPSPWEGGVEELELSEEELAEELREAAQAFARQEQEPGASDAEVPEDDAEVPEGDALAANEPSDAAVFHEAAEADEANEVVSDDDDVSHDSQDAQTDAAQVEGAPEERLDEVDSDADGPLLSLATTEEGATQPVPQTAAVPEADSAPDVSSVGQLGTFGPPDVDDFSGPEWNEPVATAGGPEVTPDQTAVLDDRAVDDRAVDDPVPDHSAASGDETPADQVTPAGPDASEDETLVDEVAEAALAAVEADVEPVQIAGLAEPSGSEAEPLSEAAHEVGAPSEGDTFEADAATQGPEPETGGDAPDVQEGSQDPRGSDVESP